MLIFIADWYRELFEVAIELYGSDIYAYYFDIPFDETVRRHQTRSKAAEFGADEIVSEIYTRVCNGL